MRHSAKRANLAAATVGVTGLLLAWIGTTLQEGQFICISKANLIAVAGFMGVVSRAIGWLLSDRNKA